MHLRKLIRLFTPPIISKIFRHLNKKKNISYEGITLPQIEHRSEKIIIIGNGPSLNTSIDKYREIIKKHDCIVVNYFALTPLYESLRPSIYVLADPAFFTGNGEFKNTAQSLLNNIVSKTTWPLQLVVPSDRLTRNFQQSILHNNNIKILSYNNTTDIPSWTNQYKAWDANIAIPPIQTVLNLCIYLSLYWGYKETYLIGADTSFITNLRVDQSNNQLYSIESHFYKNEDVYRDQGLFDDTKMRPLHTPLWQELESITNVFRSYNELQNYADYKKLKVYNASVFSWIDAFERKEPCD